MGADQRVRVSVRELYEIPKWAFVAAGASAGEAAGAARVVQLAEVHDGCGVDAAVHELDHHRIASTAVERHGGSIELIDNEEGRGLLMLGPLVAAAVAVRGPLGPPVLIRGVSPHPAIAAVLIEGLRCAPLCKTGLCAWEVMPDGSLVNGVHAGDDPDAIRRGDLNHLKPSEWPGQAGPGVLITAAPVPDGESADAADRLAAALRSGVEVDAAAWGALSAAAQHYLVKDHD